MGSPSSANTTSQEAEVMFCFIQHPGRTRPRGPLEVRSIIESMNITRHIFLPLIAGIALFAFPVSASEPGVPDFSKGMPDVNLEKKEKESET